MTTRAALPQRGYQRRLPVDESGLAVTVVDGTGRAHGPFSFADLPAHGQVRAELIRAFVACSSPQGPWQSPASVRTGHALARSFLKQLQPLGIDIASLADLTVEQWWAWRALVESRNRWPGQVSVMRTLLRHCPEVPTLTLRAMAHRTSKPRRRLQSSYSPSEFTRIRSAALKDVRAAEARVRRNTERLQAHWAGEPSGVEGTVFMNGRNWDAGELLERLYRSGRLDPNSGYRKPATSVSELLGHPSVAPTNALFPTKLETFSLMVLLVCDRGYNLSTLTSLQVPEVAGQDHRGEAVLLTHLDKPRRRRLRHFTHSHTGPGARTLELGMSMTETARAAARDMGHPSDQLLIAASSHNATNHPSRVFLVEGLTNGGTATEWSNRHKVAGDNGEPLMVSLARLRLTEQVVNRKASQNSDAVSEDTYRSPEALTAAMVADVILQGQADAITHAHDTMPMRWVDDASQVETSEETRQALREHRLDTATGACLDHLHSPFAPAGTPCTASFLNCLACPNAVATPAHLPRLATLRSALENLATAAPDRFASTYATHRDRLEDVLAQAVSPAEISGAAAHATDHDRDLIERLLRRELDG